MAENKFPSLSSFLNSARKLERNTMESALTQSTEQEVARILSESAVKLSIYNNLDSENKDSVKNTADFIKQGVADAVAANSQRVKSILDDLFSSVSVDQEREVMWIDKFCNLFNIDKGLSTDDKKALIDKQLAEDDDTLSYVTYLVETGERRNKE